MGFLAGPEALLFLQGMYSLFFLAEAARALAARFGGVEMVYVAVVVAAMAWASSSRSKRSASLPSSFRNHLPL